MGKYIKKLTVAQEARFSEYVKKWTAIGLSTEPANRAMAEDAIARIYKPLGTVPKIVWCTSPMAQSLICTLLKMYNKVD